MENRIRLQFCQNSKNFKINNKVNEQSSSMPSDALEYFCHIHTQDTRQNHNLRLDSPPLLGTNALSHPGLSGSTELCCHFLKAHHLFNYPKFKHFSVPSYTTLSALKNYPKKNYRGESGKKKTLSDTKYMYT